MAAPFKSWLYGSLLFLNTGGDSALAELAPTSYLGFNAIERCTDFQTVVKSHVELSQRMHCGNQLAHWQQWLTPQTRNKQYQWCLEQDAKTLDKLKQQLDNDFFMVITLLGLTLKQNSRRRIYVLKQLITII